MSVLKALVTGRDGDDVSQVPPHRLIAPAVVVGGSGSPVRVLALVER